MGFQKSFVFLPADPKGKVSSELFPQKNAGSALTTKAKALLESFHVLSHQELVNELVKLGVYDSLEQIQKELREANHDCIPADCSSFDEFIESNREFYREILGYLESGQAKTCKEMWELHRKELCKYTKAVQEIMNQKPKHNTLS